MKLSYTDLQDIPNPVPKDFLKYYDKCYKISHCGRDGFVLLGNLHEIFVPRDSMTAYSILVLDTLPALQIGGFILGDITGPTT
jgi:hypothetical protein